MDCEPMRRKITMKKVAGFQSLALGASTSSEEVDRSGRGIILRQKAGCKIMGRYEFELYLLEIEAVCW